MANNLPSSLYRPNLSRWAFLIGETIFIPRSKIAPSYNLLTRAMVKEAFISFLEERVR